MIQRMLTAGMIAVLAVGVGAASAERKPNLLLIFTDDHGWADLGAHGADPDTRTPRGPA